MKRNRSIKLMAALAVVAMAASFSRPPRAVQAGDALSGRVITRLVGQRQSITILSTSNGVRYSVDVDGKTIVANATLDELKQRHPESFRQIQSSTASSTPQAWAGAD